MLTVTMASRRIGGQELGRVFVLVLFVGLVTVSKVPAHPHGKVEGIKVRSVRKTFVT